MNVNCSCGFSLMNYVKTAGGTVRYTFHTDIIAVKSCFTSNYGKFAIIKIWLVNMFPDTQELYSVPITKPVGDKKNHHLLLLAYL